MRVGVSQVWRGAVVEIEKHGVCAKSANYIGDSHFFGFFQGVAQNDDVEGFTFARGKYLT
jgi:hypothetical protein